MKKMTLRTTNFGLLALLMLIMTMGSALAADPVLSGLTYAPQNPTTDDNIVFTATCTGDTALYDINYTISEGYNTSGVKGTAQNATSVDFYTLSKSRTAKDDVFIIEAFCIDRNNVTSSTASTTVLIENSAPQVSGASLTIGRESDQVSTTISASDADQETLTYSITANNINEVLCSISGTTLTVDRVTNFTGTSVCEVKVTDPDLAEAYANYTITVLPENKLSVDRAYAVINDDDGRIDNGDEFTVEPGDTLSFRFDIENLFDEDDPDGDIEDVEIEIEIQEWEDDDEQTEESDSYDIDAGDTEDDIEVEFGEVPSDIEDGSHDVIITITGRSEEGRDYEIIWDLNMEVEKENELIAIERATFQDETLSCDRYTTFSISLENLGQRDSDEIVMTAYNRDLGIDIRELELDLEAGDDWSRTYNIDISDNVAEGTYTVIVRTFFDFDDWGDEETSQIKSVPIRINDCQEDEPEPEPEEEQEQEEEEQEDVEVITDDDEEENGFVIGEPPADIDEEEQAQEEQVSSWYLIALVVLIVILIAVLIVMVSVVMKNKN